VSVSLFIEVFEDATGVNRCEVRVSRPEGHYPAMVMIEEAELDGNLLAPDARRLADILNRAAQVADRESSRTVGEGRFERAPLGDWERIG
jgi:hypothetical protein